MLKRFESCWRACLPTVRRMLAAHDAFLEGWEPIEAADVGAVCWMAVL